MGQLSDIKQIICDAADDMSSFCIVKVAERLALYMLEKLLAHIRFDVDAELMPEIIDNVLQARAEQINQ